MRRLKAIFAWAAALPWLGMALPAQAGAPTAADFARSPTLLSAKISPAGNHLAVTFWHEGVIALGVIDLKTMKMAGTIWFSRDQHVATYTWGSDQRVVIGIGKRVGALDQFALTGELFAMNPDGTQKTYLMGYQGTSSAGTYLRSTADIAPAKVIDTLPSDPDHVLIAVNRNGFDGHLAKGLTIEQLDVNNGLRRRVSYIMTSQGALSGWSGIDVAADGQGQPRYAVVQDDERRPVEMRRNSKDEGWVVLRTHEVDSRVELLGVGTDGGRAYLLSDEVGDFVCARARVIATGALETLSCGEGVDAQLAFEAMDGKPVALSYEAGRPQAAIVGDPDSPDAKAYGALLKAFAGQRVTVTSRTLDGRKLVAFVSGDRNPGEYYLFDRDAKRADFLFAPRDWIDPEAMTSVLPVEVKARDGRPLHGYLTSRGGLNPEKRPLVLLVHGGPHGERDRWEWQAEPQYLASLGYAVLQVNYRGSGGYGREFEVAGHRQWGGAMQDDLTDAVRWAVAAGIADPARVCIMGAGWGGYAAVMSAVREPALYRCAITMAGPVDLVTQSRDSDISEFRFGRLYLRDVLGDDDETLRKNSPITYLDRLQAPVLIAHGTNDQRVPFSQAKELRAELDRLHKPYEWLPFDEEKNGFYLDKNLERYLLAVKSFLAKNIGPGIPGAAPEAGRK